MGVALISMRHPREPKLSYIYRCVTGLYM